MNGWIAGELAEIHSAEISTAEVAHELEMVRAQVAFELGNGGPGWVGAPVGGFPGRRRENEGAAFGWRRSGGGVAVGAVAAASTACGGRGGRRRRDFFLRLAVWRGCQLHWSTRRRNSSESNGERCRRNLKKACCI